MTHGKHCDKHDHCDHCLHYCGTCDKPYCCKCGREWPTHNHSYWTWDNYNVPCMTGTTWTSLGANRTTTPLYATCDTHTHT